jgi:hypothetical protein
VIYFKTELKGGLNRSLDFTSPVYQCSNYSTRTGHKLYKGASRHKEKGERVKEIARARTNSDQEETILHLSESVSVKQRKRKLITKEIEKEKLAASP